MWIHLTVVVCALFMSTETIKYALTTKIKANVADTQSHHLITGSYILRKYYRTASSQNDQNTRIIFSHFATISDVTFFLSLFSLAFYSVILDSAPPTVYRLCRCLSAPAMTSFLFLTSEECEVTIAIMTVSNNEANMTCPSCRCVG
jgi:heme/copper-type cytochrome/quinol oxidase subunit 3